MEYRVGSVDGRWAVTTDDAAAMLRSLANFAGTRASDGAFEFRAAGRTEGMPDVEVRIESAGFYLCDFGGDRALARQVVGTIVLWCAGRLEGGITLVMI